jgi:hypothetical protein
MYIESPVLEQRLRGIRRIEGNVPNEYPSIAGRMVAWAAKGS